MSRYCIEKLTIKSIEPAMIRNKTPIKESDNLSIVKFVEMSFQVIAARDTKYRIGDKVFYFQPQLQIPMWLVKYFDIGNYLANGDQYDDNSILLQNRVKAIKLCGNNSEGLILPTDEFLDAFKVKRDELDVLLADNDMVKFTEVVGVTKYLTKDERLERIIQKHDGSLIAHRSTEGGVKTYDIESGKKFPERVDVLMDVLCSGTRKEHGTNGGITVDSNGEIFVFQRRFAIRGDGEDTSVYTNEFNSLGRVKMMKDLGYFEKIVEIRKYFMQLEKEASIFGEHVGRVTLRGEKLGPAIEGNYYQLEKREFHAFDIEVNGKPIDVQLFLDTCKLFDIPTVPILFTNMTLREWLNGRTLDEACEMKALNNPKVPEEGIVIKPMKEMLTEDGERLFVKYVSVTWQEYMNKI